MKKLEVKVVIVTGSGRSIGQALASNLARKGANLSLETPGKAA